MLNHKHPANDAHPTDAPRPVSRDGERGYTLVALLAAMTILALILTEAAPRLQQQAQRERERESIARGEEVVEAIAAYTAAKGAPPASMNDLVKGVDIGFKKRQVLRREASRDPLSSSGEWRLVRQNDRVYVDFSLAVTRYNGGTAPPQVLYPAFQNLRLQAAGGLIDLKKEEKPPGGEDNEPNGSGPFIGVVSRSRRKSVLAYYGIERHDRWVFTPAYR